MLPLGDSEKRKVNTSAPVAPAHASATVRRPRGHPIVSAGKINGDQKVMNMIVGIVLDGDD